MKTELQKQLQKKYSKILQNTGKTIECNDGWFNLLDKLLTKLQWDTDRNKYPQVVATQIKEKFGVLRFCYDLHTTNKCPKIEDYHSGVISGVIEFAESLSFMLCEYCGTNAEVIHTLDWDRTICRKCHKKHCPNASIVEDQKKEDQS